MKKNKRGNNIFQTLIHPLMLGLYKITFGPYISKILFKSKANGLSNLRAKGSFILIGNHVNNYDALIHQYYANRIIRFVVNERLFRMGPKGLLGKVMNWVHFIPKKKFSNDIKAVRKLFKAKENGHIIGIFPEGRRNWDGATANILESISTLVKSLKIPVVSAITKGGFSAQPRWSNDVRTGNVLVEYKTILTTDEIKSKKADEIFDVIKNELTYNEHKYLEENKTYFKYKDPAEGLERMVFMCPSCHNIGTMTSSSYTLQCSCGYSATYDNYAKLTCEHFVNLAEWSKWQKDELNKLKESSDDEDIVFEDSNIAMSSVSSSSYEKLEEKDHGTLKLYKNKIIFEGEEILEFPIDKLWGCNIQKNCSFEFNYDGIMYLFVFPDKKNAYKWKLYTEL